MYREQHPPLLPLPQSGALDRQPVSFTLPECSSCGATIGSQDLLINNIKFVLNDPVLELNGKP